MGVFSGKLINLDNRQDSHIMLDKFDSYPKRCGHYRALNTLTQCMFLFILKAGGCSHAESPKRTHGSNNNLCQEIPNIDNILQLM